MSKVNVSKSVAPSNVLQMVDFFVFFQIQEMCSFIRNFKHVLFSQYNKDHTDK